MSALPSTVVCAGCGTAAPAGEPFPFRCPNAGDETDHVMTVVLDPRRLQFPRTDEPHPFVRYRTLLHPYHVAMAGGLADTAYVDLIRTLDAAVARVDGHGFAATPFVRNPSLHDHLRMETGSVWVKDETGNVSGSHKARHLMGLLIYLEIVERLGWVRSAGVRPELAIASCGNAALAAAVVARAGGRALRVFVPTTADPRVVARLEQLGAEVTRCPREPGVTGDPTYHRLHEAVRGGSLPFTCQGPDNGLAIEGCKTLGYEMVTDLLGAHAALDRVFVQVGGGALASATMQALQDAVRLGVLENLPRIHAVQTQAVHPLKRAYDAVARRIHEKLRSHKSASPGSSTSVAGSGFSDEAQAWPDDSYAGDQARADLMASHASSATVNEELKYAAAHRSEFMRPWEHEPRSLATGIIDDETYDWLAVVGGMITSGGCPVVVSEHLLAEANEAARRTGIRVDPTGSAGLAGLLQLRDAGVVGPDEHVAVLFTGVQR